MSSVRRLSTSTARLVLPLIAAVMVASSCSGTGSESQSATSTSAVGVSTSTSPSPTSPDTPANTTSLAPATTTIPPTSTGSEMATIVTSWDERSESPLALARAVTAYPVEIAVPDTATAFEVHVNMTSGINLDDPWRWEWSYSATDGTVGDVDSSLPDNGPGAIQGQAWFEPILTGGGWKPAATVASGPLAGEQGPQSINFAYTPTDSVEVGDPSIAPTAAVGWVDESLDYLPETERRGWRVDFKGTTQPGQNPVPLAAALLDGLPTVDGARLDVFTISSQNRAPGDFGSEFGLTYLLFSAVFSIPADSVDAARKAWSEGLDGEVFSAGSPDLATQTKLVDYGPNIQGDTWTQQAVVFGRWTANLTIQPDFGEPESLRATVEVRLEPGRSPLETNP